MNRTMIVSAIVAIVVLGASHGVIRSNPIEIPQSMIRSVINVCENPESPSDLEYVMVDRYPPYRWEAHCSDGTVMRSRL